MTPKKEMRILAFLLTAGNPVRQGYQRAKRHLQSLADRFGLSISESSVGQYRLLLCHKEGIPLSEESCFSEALSLIVGPCAAQIEDGRLVDTAPDHAFIVKDRFLCLSVSKDRVSATTDYASTIPCFINIRRHFCCSNIEPLVLLDAECTLADIDPSSMYAFLRFSHFIWDRTLYRNISLQLPDSRMDWDGQQLALKSLQSLQSTNQRFGLSDRQVADELYELNQRLVKQALYWTPKIILPLSSGYDSRMIFSACAKDQALKEKLRTFTYGPESSIEVRAARSLCRKHQVRWSRIELPCHFLEKGYLEKIGAVFGSALHFHGMYQLEFMDCIRAELPDAAVTSGFMTGVPAGQHLATLQISSPQVRLDNAMNRFSQSTFWSHSDLLRICTHFDETMKEEAEAEFRKAFDSFDGELFHKSIVFDLWTRQRNFITYYPRTIEWVAPCISPHMTPEYANFFSSLSHEHLYNRHAVALMFKYHYPLDARVPSNSNRLRAITGYYNIGMFLAAVARRMKMESLIPKMFLDQPLEFDKAAMRFSRVDGLWPLFHLDKEGHEFLADFFPEALLSELLSNAIAGSDRDYGRLSIIQAIAYGIALMTGADET